VHVLYFSLDYTPHDLRFLQAISDGGHDVSYLRLEDRGLRAESRMLPRNVASVGWISGKRAARWIDWPALTMNLRKVLREVDPDVVHAGPIQGPAALAAVSGFRPLIAMSWGSDLLLGARKGLGRLAARFALSKTDVFLCDAEVVLAIAVELGMPREQCIQFPWGVDLEVFSPGDSEGLRSELEWSEEFIVLSTRSWEPIYGIETLLRGFMEAARQEPRLRLVMLGQGSLKRQVTGLVRESDLSDRIKLLGPVSNEQLPAYYRAADLYASASKSDGSSVSLMEALACGLPAVVSNIPGNREWIDAGVNGWFFPVGDAQALAQRLLEAVRAKEALSEMSSAARATAQVKADWRKGANALMRAYDLSLREGAATKV
jgi:hypothetical protein